MRARSAGVRPGATSPRLTQFRRCEICGELFEPVNPGTPYEKRCPLCEVGK